MKKFCINYMKCGGPWAHLVPFDRLCAVADNTGSAFQTNEDQNRELCCTLALYFFPVVSPTVYWGMKSDLPDKKKPIY
ncbi:hypothetical protein CEXT_255391 [Caerostris extrusa]|uniref:Uncharacterized protein n=1 Tax=Caerostris extrusa TaxID=172846 RepID=A0AAV4WPJ2_CAEEX|nr:hypothetical protein CEXT_255391 [Caerostris extrusa]